MFVTNFLFVQTCAQRFLNAIKLARFIKKLKMAGKVDFMMSCSETEKIKIKIKVVLCTYTYELGNIKYSKI